MNFSKNVERLIEHVDTENYDIDFFAFECILAVCLLKLEF